VEEGREPARIEGHPCRVDEGRDAELVNDARARALRGVAMVVGRVGAGRVGAGVRVRGVVVVVGRVGATRLGAGFVMRVLAVRVLAVRVVVRGVSAGGVGARLRAVCVLAVLAVRVVVRRVGAAGLVAVSGDARAFNATLDAALNAALKPGAARVLSEEKQADRQHAALADLLM